MTQNDTAWERLFDEHRILENVAQQGIHEISAKQINQYREARLMTKFDHHSQLPKIFSDHKLSIQPNSRGTYVIGRFDSYFSLDAVMPAPIEVVEFPASVSSINPDNIYSEASGLLCAQLSGMVSEMLGEPCQLTVMGRMSTGLFDYAITDVETQSAHQISVKNSQCEIDAGFEGATSFAIVEAKNATVDDILIRQLYYPYRLWKQKLQKRCVPIFLTISDGIFSFYIFAFDDDGSYNSIRLLEHRRFQIGSIDVELETIVTLLQETSVHAEPAGVPFPQSDSFQRLIDLLFQLKAQHTLSKDEISVMHGFHDRQSDYYTNAGRYLGLIERQHVQRETTYALTALGEQVLQMNQRERHLAFAKAILQHEVFRKTLELYLTQSERPSKQQVIDIMMQCSLKGMGAGSSTPLRRASTVLAWVDWIIELTQR